MAVDSAFTLDKSVAITLAAKLRHVLEAHDVLRNKVDLFRGELTTDSTRRADFIREIKSFLDTLRPVCGDLRTTAQYEQVSGLADEWQTILSELLREPLDVREVIGLRLPTADLRPMGRRLTRQEVLQTLKRRASETAQFRKLSHLFSQIDWLYRLTKSPEILHERFPSTSEEMDRDWSFACQFLAADVLDGRLRMTEQLDAEAFSTLTATWLEDTKRLMAYMSWLAESQDKPASAPGRDNNGKHYYRVCESLHHALLDKSRKAAVESFFDVADWIKVEFLTGGSLKMCEGSPAWRLVANKAHRIWEQTGRNDPERNWFRAEQYVRGYFEAIIPAVIDVDRKSVRAILNAVTPQRTEGPGCEIISVFEAAIAIECLDPDLVREDYKPERSYL